MEAIRFVFVLFIVVLIPLVVGRFSMGEDCANNLLDHAIAWVVGAGIMVIVGGIIGIAYSVVYLGRSL